MKRRDFISKSTLGVVVSGGLVNSIESEGKVNETLNDVNKVENETLNTVHTSRDKEVMRSSDKARSGMAIGSIGAGGAELRKDGIFYNWSIFNNLPKGTGKHLNFLADNKKLWDEKLESGFDDESMLFFVVRYKEQGKKARMKVLQIEKGPILGGIPISNTYFPWISGVETIEYSARFPVANLKFSDPEMPFEVELEAFSPFIPNDIKNSSLPVMFFDFKIISKAPMPIEISLMMTQRNAVGYDVEEKLYTSVVEDKGGAKVVTMGCDKVDQKESSWGSESLISFSSNTTYYLGWEDAIPFYETVLRSHKLPNIDDTEKRNNIETSLGKKKISERCYCTLTVAKTLNPSETFSHSYGATWYFPNLYDIKKQNIEGHYYSNFFNSSEAVADYIISNKSDLSGRTVSFLNNFYDSSADTFILNQINSQLNTFVTSSWLNKEKTFGIIEGLTPEQSWGPVATIDVGLYGSVPVIALFSDLQKSCMKAHKANQSANGEVSHGLMKGFNSKMENVAGVNRRLDLPSQYVIMVLRDFFWTNDKIYLQEMWPSLKNAIEHVLLTRDKNGDHQPDMEGIMCSYNNFPMYGLSSYIQSMWLAALSGAVQAAKALGDSGAERRYSGIYEKGKRLFEQKLWNGEYYRLYNSDLHNKKGINEGCLTDQMIGLWANKLSGLNDFLPHANVKKALTYILEVSYKPHFGLRNCSWPGDQYWHPVEKDIWVDQANTCWSGVELAFASFLIYEGMYEQGVKVIRTVNNRYKKAGLYWDHQEYGGHYYRPMAAWAILNAMLGMGLNQETLTFAPKISDKEFKLFFAIPGATAHFISKDIGGKQKISINILTGVLKCRKLVFGDVNFGKTQVEVNAEALESKKIISVESGKAVINFNKTVAFFAGQTIHVE